MRSLLSFYLHKFGLLPLLPFKTNVPNLKYLFLNYCFAGELLFQISRNNFHPSFSFFQKTRYLPASICLSFASYIINIPVSTALFPSDSTVKAVNENFFTPASNTPFQNLPMSSLFSIIPE